MPGERVQTWSWTLTPRDLLHPAYNEVQSRHGAGKKEGQRVKQAAASRADLHGCAWQQAGKTHPSPQYYKERGWEVGGIHPMDVLGRKLLNFNKLSGVHINCETKAIVLFG